LGHVEKCVVVMLLNVPVPAQAVLHFYTYAVAGFDGFDYSIMPVPALGQFFLKVTCYDIADLGPDLLEELPGFGPAVGPYAPGLVIADG